MEHILIVDDEADLRQIVRFNLEREGFGVSEAASGEETLRLLRAEGAARPDVVLLDVMMEGMSGFDVARQMQQSPGLAQIPIIFLTALGAEDDVVRGLNIGAYDYLSKPVGERELIARVRAVLRRSSAPAADALTFETLKIDAASKIASIDGRPIELTHTEFGLLCLLLENRGRVFSREQLLERVWPSDTYVLPRTVDVYITRLRKKLGRYGAQIKTRVGFGYIFE